MPLLARTSALRSPLTERSLQVIGAVWLGHSCCCSHGVGNSRAGLVGSAPGRSSSSADSTVVWLQDIQTALEQLVQHEALPARVLIRAEAGCADLILEHSCVPGFALALAAGPEHGELYWVHFGTLERSDDFDLATGGDKTIRTWSGPYDGWLEEAMATAADAVRQTLTVRIGGLRRVSIYATTPNGNVQVWSRRLPRQKAEPRVGDTTFKQLCSAFPPPDGASP